MAEIQAPVPAAAGPVSNVMKQNNQKKKNRKKLVKRVIAVAVCGAVVAAISLGMYKLVFAKEKPEYLTDVVQIGTIQSKLEGYGYPRAQNSASITLVTGGTVQEVYVQVGDMVQEGQPLYAIDSSAAEEAVTDKQKVYDNSVKLLNAQYEAIEDLVVHPPFSGKLINVAEITAGEDVSTGTRLATLVEDGRLKLSLYFSYAYEADLRVGQRATISVPASMAQLDGTVEKINRVSYITPEGSQCFEAVLVVENPGTLTDGMGATAVLQNAAGEDIYPYDGGTLKYYRTQDILTKVGGEALAVDLVNYSQVTPADVLLHMSGDDNDEKIAALEKDVRTAREALEKAQENLANFNAVAPISGTVMSCGLVAGQEVSENTVAITIADNAVMTVDISVDERQISYIKQGMSIDLSDWNGNMYFGTVTSIGLTPNTQNGATSYPVTVEMDNSSGTLMSGMSLTYSFVANEVTDCLLVPIQSVKYITGEDGEPHTVVFVQADEAPEGFVETDALAESDSSIPKNADGFYAVEVEVGIHDTYNVEISSGLEEGQSVFTDVLTNSADSWG